MAGEGNNQPNNSSGTRNINTGGGMYNEGGNLNVSGISGGVANIGGTMGNVSYTENRISSSDEAKLKDLFSNLQKEIETAPNISAEDKSDAKEAAETLQKEVEAVQKDPTHKPSRVTMKGLLAAFEAVGAPTLKVATTIIGFPALGETINQFVEHLAADQK
jgi:hypothetical protein